MYLPALKAHAHADVTAVCGRNPEKAIQFAGRWDIPNAFSDYRKMIDAGLCDAVIVASHNESHHPISLYAINHGLHVLCEKPLAISVQQAEEMEAAAKAAGVQTMVPFTYRFLPHARYIKHLIDTNYLGTPYHLNIRYYHAFGRRPGYYWGWDADLVGCGDVGNLASHPIYLAQWYFGEIKSVFAELNQSVDRGKRNPQGKPFTAADDNGVLLLRFKNGAVGSIHYSSVAYEKSCFDQHHAMEFHGSAGTLYHENDWVAKQETRGIKDGEYALKPLTIPQEFWGQAQHKTVHESYKAVFRKDGYMVGEFINSILEQPMKSQTPLPTFSDGLAVQRVIEAAIKSHKAGRRVDVGH